MSTDYKQDVPTQQAPVLNLAEKATGRMDSLHQSISTLEKRLESVLRPQGPETAISPELHDTQPRSPLTNDLDRLSVNILKAQERVQDLIDRLEV